MKRSLEDIVPVPTSHGAGMKRVLVARHDTESKVTQIAVTDLLRGEVADSHVHLDMDEYFYVLEAADTALSIEVAGIRHLCGKGDIVYVPAGSGHRLEALSDVRIMTIGVER